MKKKVLIVALLCTALAVYWLSGGVKEDEVFHLQDGKNEGTASQEQQKTTVGAAEKKEAAPELIFVDVCGAVKKPAVVKLPEGSRAFEAIDVAGGVTQEGDTVSINLASQLSDGQQLYVPFRTESQQAVSNSPAGQVFPDGAGGLTTQGMSKDFAAAGRLENGRININTADSEELQKIKGIGPAMAKRILDYRKSNGRFASVDDLTNVKGIGTKTLEKLRNSVSV